MNETKSPERTMVNYDTKADGITFGLCGSDIIAAGTISWLTYMAREHAISYLCGKEEDEHGVVGLRFTDKRRQMEYLEKISEVLKSLSSHLHGKITLVYDESLWRPEDGLGPHGRIIFFAIEPAYSPDIFFIRIDLHPHADPYAWIGDEPRPCNPFKVSYEGAGAPGPITSGGPLPWTPQNKSTS